jgi:hypothetical protein
MGFFDGLFGKNPKQVADKLRKYSDEFVGDIHKVSMPNANLSDKDINPTELIILGMFLVTMMYNLKYYKNNPDKTKQVIDEYNDIMSNLFADWLVKASQSIGVEILTNDILAFFDNAYSRSNEYRNSFPQDMDFYPGKLLSETIRLF